MRIPGPGPTGALSGPRPLLVSLAVVAPKTLPRNRDGLIDIGLWALVVLLAAGTLASSLGPEPPGANLFRGADKVGHAFAYFLTLLCLLFAVVWRPGRGDGPWPHAAWLLAGAAVAAGAWVEVLQTMVHRDAQVSDVLVNASGALLAVAVHRLIRWWAT